MKTLVTLMILAAGALAAAPVKIVLPPETAKLVESPLPGYALAQAMCLTCHSAEYLLYQPPTSPRTYWQATLTKMQKTFGAPLPDEMVPPILEYLVKTYGAERDGAQAAAPAVTGATGTADPAGKKAP